MAVLASPGPICGRCCLRHPCKILLTWPRAPGVLGRMTDDLESPPPKQEQPAAFPQHQTPDTLCRTFARTSIDVSETQLAMLPFTARRVATSAPQASLLSTSAAVASHAPRAAATAAAAALSPARQRRYSSSKPSPKNRSNGPKDLPAGETVSAGASSGEVKTPSEKRKRKGKAQDGASDPFQGFPSVPSTQHVSQEGMFVTRLPSFCHRDER